MFAHQRTTSLTVSVAVGVAAFIIAGGFATGWGNALAAVAFAFGIWIGMTLILRLF
jgi:hypothetical protein